jgi:hypothetical protein
VDADRIGKKAVFPESPGKVRKDFVDLVYCIPAFAFMDNVDIRHLVLTWDKNPKLILAQEILKYGKMVPKHLKNGTIPGIFIGRVEFSPIMKKPITLDLNNPSLIMQEPNTRKRHFREDKFLRGSLMRTFNQR